MRVSDKIYFDLDRERVPETVLIPLTYPNPEFYQKMDLGFSTLGIPETLQSFEIVDRELRVMRGEALKIKPYFTPEQWQPQFQHPDHPVTLQYINNDFPLDQHQEGAVAAMKGMRQGIVHAVTSAGKSLILLKAIVEIGQRALIVVHRKILMEQLLKDIDKYIRDEKGEKIKAGIIGNGACTVGDITIAIDKTLARHLDRYREEFGTLILDECHLAPATTIFSLINAINTRNRYGLSGTLRRKDQKEFLIYSTFGEVIYTIGKDVLLEAGRVVPVDIEVLESETRFDWDHVVESLSAEGNKNPTAAARHLREMAIAGDPVRRDLVLDQVKRLYDTGGKTIVLSRYVAPCYELQEALHARFGIEAGVITGQDSKAALEAYRGMKDRDLKVIFATVGCVSTGVSISDLDNIVLISPIYNNELLLHQIRGRLMRVSEGKTHGTLYFVYDPYIFHGGKLSQFLRIMRS